MQPNYPQRGVIWVRQVVDDCVQTVATNVVIVDSRSGDELRVSGGSEQWVRKVAEEVLEKSGDRGNIVVE